MGIPRRCHDTLRRIGAHLHKPDAVVKPSTAVRQLVPKFQKTNGAHRLAQHLSLQRNRSPSFQALIQGIHNLSRDMPQHQTPPK